MARTKYPHNQTLLASSNRQEPPEENFKKLDELGVAGVKIQSGFVHDEFLTQLIGRNGQRVYRQMRDNDDMVGAIFFMLEGLMKAVEWRVEYEEGDTEGTELAKPEQAESEGFRGITTPEEATDFLEGVLFDDMTHSWEDYLMNVVTGYTFGWQWSEIVWKKRNGSNPNKIPAPGVPPSSIFDDGMIGIDKLADRSQETLDLWDEQNGTVYGMWQQPPNGGQRLYIPSWKSVHFKTLPNKDNPEGRSMLRNAYRPWYFKTNIQEFEATGIERELNGLPLVYIPQANLNDTSDKTSYEGLVRNVKFNEQGGMVLPSDPWRDAEGNPTNLRMVDFQLVTAGGSRAIDTNAVIVRYDMAIARSVLAQFLTMGMSGSKGGFAQSRNETDLFFKAAQGMINNIASTCNRQLVPAIWQINGLDPALMPYLKPGRLQPEDLQVLGDFVQKLSASGIPLFDKDTVDHLRGVGGLPLSDEESEDENLVFDEDDEEKNNE